MATVHQVIFCTKEAGRVYIDEFEDDGDWVATAKERAKNWIRNSASTFLQWHASNGALTVWID